MDHQTEIEVPVTPMHLVEHDHGMAAVADRDMPVLTAEMVRDTLDHVRRALPNRSVPRRRAWPG